MGRALLILDALIGKQGLFPGDRNIAVIDRTLGQGDSKSGLFSGNILHPMAQGIASRAVTIGADLGFGPPYPILLLHLCEPDKICLAEWWYASMVEKMPNPGAIAIDGIGG